MTRKFQSKVEDECLSLCVKQSKLVSFQISSDAITVRLAKATVFPSTDYARKCRTRRWVRTWWLRGCCTACKLRSLLRSSRSSKTYPKQNSRTV